jgi:hypothetical protein
MNLLSCPLPRVEKRKRHKKIWKSGPTDAMSYAKSR